MSSDSLHGLLKELPKCEHHMHLEGALEPDLLFEFASRNNISLPSSKDDPAFASPTALSKRFDRFTSLDDFLHYYFIGMSSLIQEQDFEELAWRYFLKAKADGVMHAEVFFDPQAHTSRGVPYKTIVAGFVKACRRAEAELDISTLLIPCILRHLPVSDSWNMYEEVEPDLKSGLLAGLGLSSTEKDKPPSRWKDVFKRAEGSGIKRTAHAGEEGPVGFIEEAMRELAIQRIDHGRSLVNDPKLTEEVASKRLLVTLCPVSNLKLQGVTDLRQLPIQKFLDAGVSFSINSDDPAYFKSYILDCYYAVQGAFALKVQDWETIATNAINGSWCDSARKEVLLDRVRKAIDKYRSQ